MFLKNLNPVQTEAVTFPDGPLLILAGAGSGKTRVLTSRIAYLVLGQGVDPASILAVTFTNKAAGEMRARLTRLIGTEARHLWLGTFHSLGLRLLRKEARAAGIDADLTVYSDDDQLSLVKQVMTELSINEKAFPPKTILSHINQAKNDDIGPSEYASHSHDFFTERVAKVYAGYQKRLREMNCMDFGDLICEPVRLLKSNPGLLDKYRSLFAHILVDEYQDTNKAQYVLTNLLASGSRNILAVGDPDQSIYAWRGADISNILDFEKDYPDATVLRLEQNYRSTKNILSAANSIIQLNKKRLKKDLWTENHDGAPVEFEEAADEHAEVRLVIKKIRENLSRHSALKYGDIAIFYRTNAQSRVFEEAFIRDGIPYTIVGGVRFYDRKEIKDAIAYLRVILNPGDAMSFQRVINTPPRRIGKSTLDKVFDFAAQRNLAVYDGFRDALDFGILGKVAASTFINPVEAFRKDAGKTPLHELVLRLLEDTGYMGALQQEGSSESLERLENLFEFISAVKDFEANNPESGLAEFLDHIALISDLDGYTEKSDRLTLMTLHSAKGLEFKVVFIAGMEEGLFPHSRSADDPEELEEERRLCYVGMTRAMERLYLSSAAMRTVYGESRYQLRSRFIEEISPEFLKITTPVEDPFARKRGYSVNKPAYSGGYPAKRQGAPKADSEEVYYTSEDSQVADHGDGGGVQGGSGWKIGMRVTHPSFGVGIIKEKSGSGDSTKLTVNFRDAGIKKLIVKFASLTPGG